MNNFQYFIDQQIQVTAFDQLLIGGKDGGEKDCITTLQGLLLIVADGLREWLAASGINRIPG